MGEYRHPGNKSQENRMFTKITEFVRDIDVRSLAVGAVLGVLLLGVSQCALAIEPGWYAPSDNGEGLIVRCNDADECAVLWVTHGKAGEQLWLISVENCLRFAMVCDTKMAQTTGLWRGLGGDTVIADPTVTLSLAADGDDIIATWDARAQFPGRCFGLGSGGLLLEGCVNTSGKRFELLAR